MDIIINDRLTSVVQGQTLIKAGQHGKSHMGYVCGGNGICQTCYVRVLEGGETLSPLNDIERAFLSERQIAAGGRLGCQATVEREGRLRVITRPEEMARMLFNPFAFVPFAAAMGVDTAMKIVPGVSNVVGRVSRGEIKRGGEAMNELMEAAGACVQLAVDRIGSIIPFREQLAGIISSLPLPALPALPALPFMPQPQEKRELVSVKVSAPAAPSKGV